MNRNIFSYWATFLFAITSIRRGWRATSISRLNHSVIGLCLVLIALFVLWVSSDHIKEQYLVFSPYSVIWRFLTQLIYIPTLCWAAYFRLLGHCWVFQFICLYSCSQVNWRGRGASNDALAHWVWKVFLCLRVSDRQNTLGAGHSLFQVWDSLFSVQVHATSRSELLWHCLLKLLVYCH
jgi:hypothetical protein